MSFSQLEISYFGQSYWKMKGKDTFLPFVYLSVSVSDRKKYKYSILVYCVLKFSCKTTRKTVQTVYLMVRRQFFLSGLCKAQNIIMYK